MKKLYDLTVLQAKELLEEKKISGIELTESIIKRINNSETKINAFITLSLESALKTAKNLDKKAKNNESIKPLEGISFAVKDSFVTDEIKTTVGSKILENYIGQYDTTVVKRLKKAGAIIIGKTNLDEFCLGFTTETSAFKTTSNPWDLSRLPGGSSGGSAAAVIAGECIFSIGSEHYDSIRQPASWCGVVGLKPTYGLVSRYGIIAMASSLECPGPITKSVKDAGFILSLMAGFDNHDANSLKVKIPLYHKKIKKIKKGMKIGLPKEYFSNDVEKGVLKQIRAAIKILKTAGVKFITINLPSIKKTSSIFEVLYRAEVASNLARYDSIRYGKSSFESNLDKNYLNYREKFGPLIKRLILTDLRAVSGGEFENIYLDALKLRTLINNEFKKIFNTVDLIIGPMSPCIAFKKGFYKEGRYLGDNDTNKFRPIVDMIAQLPALCGFPGISVPCGFSKNMPVGLNIYGPKLSEQKILNAAYTYEQLTNWHKKRPKL